MPLGYHISADEGLITVHGQGEITLQEVARLGQTMLADPEYDPDLPQLLDFRGLRPVLEGTLEAMEAFVHGPYRDGVTANVAVVIDEHLESRHCADIYLLTCAIHDAELFCDYDQALRWLMREAFATQPLPLLAEHQYAQGDHPYGPPE